MKSRWIMAAGLFLLIATTLAACGETPGTVAEPRVIEVQTLDELRFDPDEVTVEVGETIRFVVTNPGEIAHEFVLGQEDVQMAHEEAMEMGEMHEGMDVPGQLAALDVQPGETKEATVTFDEAGEVPYGCHEVGHFDGGMVGTVIVEG